MVHGWAWRFSQRLAGYQQPSEVIVKTVQFRGKKLTVEMAQYRNGCTAIMLFDDEDEEPYAAASVALPVRHPDGCVWVKDYSENTA